MYKTIIYGKRDNCAYLYQIPDNNCFLGKREEKEMEIEVQQYL